MSRTPARTTVRLTGIALRHQGSHDSLCAYYAAAMLLCALRPELDDCFEAAHVARDPLFGNLPRRRGQSVERVAAAWLTSGVALPALARALDGACNPRPRAKGKTTASTRFHYRRAACDEATLAALHTSIDSGLPCLLGWESRELGDHTALVVGYDRFTGRGTRRDGRWLRLLDPIRIQEQLEWRQLAQLISAPLEIVSCRAHDGWRPDKLTVERDAKGTPLHTRIERWEPRQNSWRGLVAAPAAPAAAD